MTLSPEMSDEVAAAFDAMPPDHRAELLRVRRLILDVAEDVGAAPVQEVLRWGQPSYLSARPRESTAIRLGSRGQDGHFALLFHCQSSVLPQFRDMFPTGFRYEGDRAILFLPGEDLQEDKLRLCIAHALQYRVKDRVTT